MPSEEKKSKIQFIICPACNGKGKNERGLACSNCSGMGIGAFYHSRFFYWGPKLGKAIIKLSHLKRGLHLFLNSAAFTFGIIGLGALFWWIWQSSEHLYSPEAFTFWRSKHWLILIFWLSLLADMFIIYRISEEEATKQKIKKPKYEERNKQFTLPNNWDELRRIKPRLRVDASSGFSYGAVKAVENAYALASEARHSEVKPIHLFFCLLRDNEISAIFSRLNADGSKLVGKLKNQLLSPDANKEKTFLSNKVKEIFVEAYINAMELGQKRVEARDLILPSLSRDDVLMEILYDLEIDRDKINNVIQWFRINERLLENYRKYRVMARFKPASSMDRAYTAVATPVLNHFAHDLTMAAKWGRLELCVGREKEVEEILQAMESGQSGIILVGPVGVGKNIIIGKIAQLMVEEDVPRLLKDKRLVELDVSRLVSGADPSQAEERLLVIIDEVARAGNIILFIDNIENLMGITSGTEESLDLSEVLANAIERGNLICLAAATSENYVQYIENKPLGNAMARIEIKEPDINQAIQMAESKVSYFEAKYKVYFSYNCLARAVELTSKYIHDKFLPAKAITVLENVAVKVAKTKGINSIVTKEDMAVIISEITRIPVTKVGETEGKDLLNLEEKIHSRMIDQKEAVEMVAASLRRARTELREGKRPIANFLFLGPTGVGKTELAKTVAKVYFGNEDYMIRLDMSEYQHPDSVNKMIGSVNETGYLTEAVRKAPFSLILLDEFEKAHPDILNLFLQVMDDGRLTDGQGRTIDFTNCIIIATSNAGAIFIQEQIIAGTDIEEIKQKLINEHLNKVMRPELINRFDGVVVFKPLSQDDVIKIAGLMLNKTKNMLEAKGIGLKLDGEGVKKIAQEGFDPKFGARPLRRVIQEKIENEIANKILAGEINRRDVVVIDSEAKILVEKGREL